MPHDSRRPRARHSDAKGGSEEERHPGRFLWIVDGHNAIFAVEEWEDLQVAGSRRDARNSLEDSLETFGRAAGTQVYVVYDGNHMEKNPDAVDRLHLHSEYSLPPEEADDRIRYLARRALQDSRRPVVVTSDRRTLADSLPDGVRRMDVRTFFRIVHARRLRRPEKWIPDGMKMDDVERYFLSRSPHEEDRDAACDGADEG